MPGSADGTGSAARFTSPSEVAVDSANNLYVADTGNHTIRKITPAGLVSTFAGSPGMPGSADGTGAAARFNSPIGLSLDGAGNLYVGDADNDTIRKITPAGAVTTLAGKAEEVGSADGTGSNARFNGPRGVAVNAAGDVYVADTFNNTIRKITPAGVVSTLAGLAGATGSADGTGSAARFNHPRGVAVDTASNIFVADTTNDTIRRITPAGVVTTVAGSAGVGGSADGSIFAARFLAPFSIKVSSSGDIYLADTVNDTIRKISAVGVVNTLGGVPLMAGSADGTGANAQFTSPEGVGLDSAGNLFIGDTGNNTIRLGQSGSPSPSPSPTASPSPSPSPGPGRSQPLNISTRLRVETGQNVMIGGFIINGSASKKVIIRAIGPSLAQFGVTGVLADPVLELHGANGGLITSNDNWQESANKQAIIDAGFAPQDSLESAILTTLASGSYTAIVSGKNGTSGVGLVEVYDLDQTVDSTLANISTRGLVQTEDNVMIGGFILGGGDAGAQVLIRALGPSLAQFGVTGVLADPTLELHNSNGDLAGSNDNWKSLQQADIEATGIPPQNDAESALVTELAPGSYTAIVAGRDGAVGVGLVEIYALQ
jgi:sugar lactone lactonase YvrE